MQIYTNFESNSQRLNDKTCFKFSCFRCKSTQILKAIHNARQTAKSSPTVVSDANLHKFWKQFTTKSKLLSCGMSCFRCKSTQILKAIHNSSLTTARNITLFPMQIYTNFESNSQLYYFAYLYIVSCFRCKSTQILKAIHNVLTHCQATHAVVSDANLHKFWQQTTLITYKNTPLDFVLSFFLKV